MRYTKRKRRGASSVSEAWRSGCGENPISSLPSCEWHKSPKINLSVEWKASWGASDWTSIIYGISRVWHGSRGEINRVIAVNSATYTTGAMHCRPHHYNFRTTARCIHLLPSGQQTSFAMDARSGIDIRGGRGEGRNGANNRRNEPPLSFARIATDGRRGRQRERNRP